NTGKRLETWRYQWLVPGTCLPLCPSQSWDVQVLPQRFLIKTSASVPAWLLKMPRVSQGNNDDTNHNPVDDKHLQSVGLQIANEPCDRGVTHNRRNDNANQEWR